MIYLEDVCGESIEELREKVKLHKDPVVIFRFSQLLLEKAFSIQTSETTTCSSSGSSAVIAGRNDTSLSSLSSGSLPTKIKSERSCLSPEMEKKTLIKESVHWLQLLSAKGYPEAQYLLGDAYSSGVLGKIDPVKAFGLFLAAAKHGHVESAYRVACCHEQGIGCSRDALKTTKFLTMAASKNHPSAMFKLGFFIFHAKMGFPADKNTKIKGIKWLTLAAKFANNLTCAAPYELAKIYQSGFSDVIISDKQYAVELFTKAAELGHHKSCGVLGSLYELGDPYYGVSQNPTLSIQYYRLGASGGDLKSMMGLCGWYLVGNGSLLQKNTNKAFSYAMLAAQNGLPKAQFTLSYFLQKGIGCVVNVEEADKWLHIAAENGYQRAVDTLQKRSSSVSPNGKQPTNNKRKSLLSLSNFSVHSLIPNQTDSSKTSTFQSTLYKSQSASKSSLASLRSPLHTHSRSFSLSRGFSFKNKTTA